MTLRADSDALVLRPLGGPVELRRHRPGPGRRLPARPGDSRSYATLAALAEGQTGASELLGRLSAPSEPGVLREHFEDAARHISPSNSRALDALEQAVELVLDRLDQAHGEVLVLPGADRIDAPSLRLVGLAWSRRAHRPGARLVLELHDSLPATAETAHDAARLATLRGVVAALRAEVEPVASAPAGAAGAAVTFEVALAAFQQRNYERASAGPAEAPDDLLLQALVAARCGQRQLALTCLADMERRAVRSEDRARACSTRAVVQAKLGGPAALADAMAAVRRGLEYAGDDPGVEATGQRGWLFNNAGLVEVMAGLHHRDPHALNRASGWLRRAMAEVARLPADCFPGLHYNVRANAVQLLEMQGRLPEAIDWLQRTFTGTEHPSYHYRCAALALKAGSPAEAIESLERAEGLCTPREWPFLEHIERARGAALFRLDRIGEAADCFRRGLALCWRVRAATGCRHHAAGLLACLRSQGNHSQTECLTEWVVAQDGLSLPTPEAAAEPPPPAGKLPPHVPELDLYWPGRPDINQQLNQIKENRS